MRSRFHYLRDPVFLAATVLYLANRYIFRPLEGPHGGFFHNYGNDILCIPFLLPPVLRVYRAIGLRWHDRMPTRFELFTHLVVWSIVFEGIAPRMGGIYAWTKADPWDVVAYAAGAIIAGAYWGVFAPRTCGARVSLTEPAP